MNDEDWRERAARAARVRTGDDPRWKRNGDIEEMGVMPGLRWANWIAEHGVTPKLVPAEYWSLDADETGAPVAVIACPCGDQPEPLARAPMIPCERCERYFFFDGEHVYCFNTPASDAATIVVA